jgi:hypothetical protein
MPDAVGLCDGVLVRAVELRSLGCRVARDSRIEASRRHQAMAGCTRRVYPITHEEHDDDACVSLRELRAGTRGRTLRSAQPHSPSLFPLFYLLTFRVYRLEGLAWARSSSSPRPGV